LPTVALSPAAGIFLVGLAGCAASQTINPTALIPSYGKYDIRQAKLFGVISSGISDPYNLAVDATSTLYVQNNNNTVTEYPKGHSQPIKTLTEPPAGPGGLRTNLRSIAWSDVST
jgi:hypothetical protein